MTQDLADEVLAGDRRALARAITLVESTRPADRPAAEALLERLLPHAGKADRIGISGVPGVGKSTFIEAFGLHAITKGRRVAVLAVDPSSRRSHGSILGDKTRMEMLARNPAAFIRPSPAGATLGGVARRTREAMLVAEAAGYDLVLVETVGVGQSETAVADMVDMFVLLLLPGGGDELQGIKKGIVELADALLVNKAEGALKAVAERSVADYRAALRLIRAGGADWTPPVVACSALAGDGIAEAYAMVLAHKAATEASGRRARRRAEQAGAWLWSELTEGLLARFRADARVAALLPAVEAEVRAGRVNPAAAARRLLEGQG